jgi:SAM-dependent methyltransferase
MLAAARRVCLRRERLASAAALCTASAASAAGVHGVAAAGFSAGSAAAYDAGRPEWQLSHARAALALAGISRRTRASACGARFPGAPVLELGAGTGKFTAALVAALAEVAPAGAAPHVVCAEPSPGFAAAWRSRAAALGARGAALRLLPAPAADLSALGGGACSAAFAAQALHWFAEDGAGAEIARVLGKNGIFISLWNCRDAARAGAWLEDYEAVIASAYAPDTPSWLSRRWEGWARGSAHFEQPPALMRWERDAGGHVGDAATMLAAAMSISEIARSPPADRRRFEDRLRAAIARAPRLPGGDNILMPMYTEALVLRVAAAA